LKQNYLVVQPVRGVYYKCSWQKALEVVVNNLKQHEHPLFFGLQIDASNHKTMFNILIGSRHKKLCNSLFKNAYGMFNCLKITMENIQLEKSFSQVQITQIAILKENIHQYPHTA